MVSPDEARLAISPPRMNILLKIGVFAGALMMFVAVLCTSEVCKDPYHDEDDHNSFHVCEAHVKAIALCVCGIVLILLCAYRMYLFTGEFQKWRWEQLPASDRQALLQSEATRFLGSSIGDGLSSIGLGISSLNLGLGATALSNTVRKQ
jgi:hypothetical protein